MQVSKPGQTFPEFGTLEIPAVLYDGINVFLSYEEFFRLGGGKLALRFGNVINFRTTPENVGGLRRCTHPVHPGGFP